MKVQFAVVKYINNCKRSTKYKCLIWNEIPTKKYCPFNENFVIYVIYIIIGVKRLREMQLTTLLIKLIIS